MQVVTEMEWHKISGENLDVDYGIMMTEKEAGRFFADLEDQVRYLEGDLAKVNIFGKWQQIPRQQACIWLSLASE